jgi:alpha-L-rhamnosidase
MKFAVVFLGLVALAQQPVVPAIPPSADPTLGLKIAGGPFTDTPPKTPPAVEKWIWAGVTAGRQTIFARAEFTLPQVFKSAVVYATGDDAFELYLNGHKIGATPAPVADLAWENVQRIPVTGLVAAGRNVIAACAVNQGGAAGLLVRLEVDGKVVLVTDEHWRATDQAGLPPAWTQAGFDDSRWLPATGIATRGEGPWGNNLHGWSDVDVEASYMKHMVIWPQSAHAVASAANCVGVETLTNTTASVKIQPDPSGQSGSVVLLVDFGQELAGRLQIWGTEGAPVTLTTGESAEECVRAEPALDNSGPFKITLAGSEPASTRYSAFRFARLVFTGKEPVELTRLVCDHKYYPVQYRGSFDCSDPLLTRIWYVGAYTAHLCMQEEIWDAPKRDRGLWIGDLQVTGQTINWVFADKFLMEHSIARVRDLAQGGRPPTELPGSDVNTLPGYSASWFCTLADFHRHAGDREFLAQQHEKIISLLKYQQTLFDANNLFINPHNAWTFCDWSPGFVVDSPLARPTTQLYIILGVHEAAYLLRELGDAANAGRYSAWADQLTAAARAKFVNPATQTYSDRLQQNVMAVLSGTATVEQGREIYERIIRPGSPAWAVRRDGDVLTPYYGYFVLQAMDKLAHNQDGLNFIRRYWGDMLRRGATTCWEMFDPSWPEGMKAALDKVIYLSLSHGWSSGPTTYLTETVLGVRPTGAGFSTVEIRPELGDLTWAEGEVPTPDGLIHVRVERQNDRQTAVVKLPPNIFATIQLSGKTLRADKAGTYRISTP